MVEQSHITNCVLVSDPDAAPLFTSPGGDVCVRLNRYAVIPLALFEAMGGDQHPAYRKWCADRMRELPIATPEQQDWRHSVEDAA
jgi:hypothetical protein